MILLLGTPAFSPFRLDALRETLARVNPDFRTLDIDARWVYALQTQGAAEQDLSRAATLLNATGACDGADFFVFPRKGTISPWSTKATDIFRNCGLKSILRVERGIRFLIGAARPHVPHVSHDPAEQAQPVTLPPAALAALHDKMTEGVYASVDDLFAADEPREGRTYDVLKKGVQAVREANEEMGLAISNEELKYLAASFKAAKRNPTDTELTMFGQVNSEHCRHKIFGAEFIIGGKKMPHSLFGMIKNTHKKRPQDTLSAYKDNSAVIRGFKTDIFSIDAKTSDYTFKKDDLDILMKVETHNHPTAISPFPGAATGVGGEIRDEAATGSGSRTVAGICGFMVSNLRIPYFPQPWERLYADFPTRLATPLQIMTEGPIGGATFGNEFGRPQLCGFFRTLETEEAGALRGYHKPIMLAGGMGVIRESQIEKKPVTPGALIVQIGGPAMRIGLGGGAASSMMTGTNSEDLDFNSVQRGNAEMQRRCQGVIDACASLGAANPILSIHDIGAGGLSNGCPELVEATGGRFELRQVPNEEKSMSPMEIWCCEAQERYVLALRPEGRQFFEGLCARERCPVAFIGVATGDSQLVLHDEHFKNNPIDMPIQVLLGKPPRMVRKVKRVTAKHRPVTFEGVRPMDALTRVLHLPAVADKTFLITIADRSVTGRVARDQMVGPYQLPVADAAVTTLGYKTFKGQAMATGERTPVALLDGPASGRLAVTEAIMNLAGVDVGDLSAVRLSANWMAPCGDPGEDAILYDTVEEVGLKFCPKLGVSIPVGKDSCSMHTVWRDAKGEEKKQIAPLSLVVSAFAPVGDVRLTLTPDLKRTSAKEKSALVYVTLGAKGERPLGATALAQVYGALGDDHADIEAATLKRFFAVMQQIVRERLAQAYHDVSDGGVAVTLTEMAMAGGQGLDITLPDGDALSELFSENPGCVLQIVDPIAPSKKGTRLEKVLALFKAAKISACVIGAPTSDRKVTISVGSRDVIKTDLTFLRRAWSETTYRMQALRDNPVCAKEEYDNALNEGDRGMNFRVTYDPEELPNGRDFGQSRTLAQGAAPKVAVLREQGVNGHIEMAAAFSLAGFACRDVHMSDLIAGRVDLKDFDGLVACGGFSYGDVLGAGSGWARSILFNDRLRAMFQAFFERPTTFSLGVCNGCQMLSQLKEIIPGADRWPRFVRNLSEQFEARFVTVEIEPSPSIFFKGMEGSRLPIAVAHGEGRVWTDGFAPQICAAHYVDNDGRATTRYPYNPNGSVGGQTAFTSADGRATILMPHPERGFRACQLSYQDGSFKKNGPWMRMFQNAFAFSMSHR